MELRSGCREKLMRKGRAQVPPATQKAEARAPAPDGRLAGVRGENSPPLQKSSTRFRCESLIPDDRPARLRIGGIRVRGAPPADNALSTATKPPPTGAAMCFEGRAPRRLICLPRHLFKQKRTTKTEGCREGHKRQSPQAKKRGREAKVFDATTAKSRNQLTMRE